MEKKRVMTNCDMIPKMGEAGRQRYESIYIRTASESRMLSIIRNELA